MKQISLQEARKMTDATLLRTSSESELRAWAEGMHEIGPRNICIFPGYLHLVLDLFSPATVVSFPHGADSTSSKLHQIEDALSEGASEIDLVAPLRYIASGDWKAFRREIDLLPDLPLKLILETSLWSDDQILRAGKEALDGGVRTLKTSTGSAGGASERAVGLLAQAGAKSIKASGGIRSLPDARRMTGAGATILGSSNVEEWS